MNSTKSNKAYIKIKFEYGFQELFDLYISNWLGLKYKQICFTISQKLAELLPRDISCCDRMNIENVVKSNCSRRNAVHWVQVYIEPICVYVTQYIIFLLLNLTFSQQKNVLQAENINIKWTKIEWKAFISIEVICILDAQYDQFLGKNIRYNVELKIADQYYVINIWYS